MAINCFSSQLFLFQQPPNAKKITEWKLLLRCKILNYYLPPGTVFYLKPFEKWNICTPLGSDTSLLVNKLINKNSVIAKSAYGLF